ncbi:YkgJ family cysteine cluster protein [Singulisphaera sp. PoT]|uniref:YkgJ family cysteine cluster protein n=1 Tax=Singulisphaera sp. PoT TaxID=3411797 RepID=UPI003BF4BD93
MSSEELETPWYHEGLTFGCTKCGACCTGAPGYVWVDAEEMARLAEFRGETLEQFAMQFVRQVGDSYSLIEKPGGDCIFWEKGVGCTVYPARPVQCQTWPFWSENIETKESWDHIVSICPGSGRGSGRWFSLEEIQAAAARLES